MGRLWEWASDEKVQKTCTFVFGGLALIVGAAWTVYVYYHPLPASRSAGNDLISAQLATGTLGVPPAPGPTGTPTGIFGRPKDLGGAWIGKTGMCHLITVEGSKLSISNYSTDGQFLSKGWGTYQTGGVSFFYDIGGEKQHPVLTLSQDRKSLVGETLTPTDRLPSRWTSAGPDCPQVRKH